MNELPWVVKDEFEALGRHMIASGNEFAAETMELLQKGVPYALVALVLAFGAKRGYDFFTKRSLGAEDTL